MRAEIWQLLDSRSIGGIESHVCTLAEGLAEAGERVRVLLLTDHGPHPMAARLERAGLPLEVLGGGLRGLVRAIRARRPGVVHTHGYKCNLLGRAAARLTGSPVVATMHSGEPGTGKLRLYLTLDRLTSLLGPAIAVSPSVARQLPGRPFTLANFVAVPAAIQVPAAAVGFVGRLSHEKGPDLFATLAAGLPGGRFVVFGDGPDRAAIAAGPVDWRGMVQDMSPHWAEIGLLCMPSRHEGLPMAALEAMARGIPVAAFAVGALPDFIVDGENGLLATPGDLTALRAAVERWLDMQPAERARMAKAAHATVRERFDRAEAVEAVLAIYRKAGAT